MVVVTISMVQMQNDVVSKNMNVKVFNVISRTNKTRYIKWHESCKYKFRLDASVCKIKADVNAKN